MKIKTTDTTRCLASLMLTLLLGAGLTAFAATTASWTPDANDAWNTPGNWDPATVPNGIGDTAIFTNNISGTRLITNDVNVTLGTLWVGSLDGVANFTITNASGNTLTFDNNGAGAELIQLTGNSASDRIYPPVVLADNLMVTNSISKVIQVYGIISESGGAKTITKTGAGQLTLAGAGNSFSGGLIVKGGLASVASSSASKAGTGPITLGDTTGTSSAQLVGNANCTNAITVVAGSTGLKTIRNAGSSAAATYSGPIVLEDDVTFNAGNSTLSTTISGVVSGTRAVTSSGSSTVGIYVALTGVNTFGGGLTLQSGTLRVGNSSALGVGTMSIAGGTLSSASATVYTLTNPIVVNGDFKLGEASGGTGNLTLSGPVSFGSATRTITVNNTGADLITGVISGDPGVGLIKAGSGALTVNGANTYSGGATINAGTLGCGNASSLGTGSATLGAASGTATATLTSGNVTITNAITVAAGGTGVRTVRNNGTASTTLSGPILLDNNLTASTAAGGSATLSGEISGGGLLTVSRDATVSANGITLSRSNTFTGGVLLSLGTLRIGDHHALGTGTLTINDGTIFCSNGNSHRDPTNSVVVNGNFTVGQPVGIGAGSIVFYGDMDLGAATRTITLSNTVSDSIYGVISGTGGLIKAGGVALYLYGANTYAGDTTVSSGSLIVTNATGSGTGSGNVTVQAGAILSVLGTISGNVTVESQGLLRGKGGTVNGAVTVNTGGALVPGNSLTTIGALNINNTLTLAADSATLMKIDRANGTNDTIQGVTTLTYGGMLTVTNLGGDFIGGEVYKLFTATTYNPGDFSATNLPSLGGGLSWAWDPANGTLSVLGGGIATTPTNISYSVSGTTLTLTWPESHLGWYAQSNSVDVADASSWFNIADSQSVTNLDIPIEPTTPKVFYRLRKP